MNTLVDIDTVIDLLALVALIVVAFALNKLFDLLAALRVEVDAEGQQADDEPKEDHANSTSQSDSES